MSDTTQRYVTNHEVLNNFRKLQLLEEHKRIQETGDPASLSGLANRTKEKFPLNKLPAKATISRIIRNETKIKDDYKIHRIYSFHEKVP